MDCAVPALQALENDPVDLTAWRLPSSSSWASAHVLKKMGLHWALEDELADVVSNELPRYQEAARGQSSPCRPYCGWMRAETVCIFPQLSSTSNWSD